MDNMDYLNKISAKPAPTNDNRLFSPLMIKILIGAAAVLVLVIALGAITSSANSRNATLYQTFYLRLKNLSDEKGPIAVYSRNIQSSELRAIAGTLKSSLAGTAREFSPILADDLKIDLKKLDPKVIDSETDHLIQFASTLQNAKLNGLLDRTFGSATALQISLILTMGSEILERNPSDNTKTLIDKFITDLQILHAQFVQFNSSSN